MWRVLVIDDDPAITSVLKRGLAYEGFAVDVVQSGPEGLAIARERPPDIVLLDVMMPTMDGYEVLHRLREADDQLPIVMLTAKDAPADQVQGFFGAPTITSSSRFSLLYSSRDSARSWNWEASRV